MLYEVITQLGADHRIVDRRDTLARQAGDGAQVARHAVGNRHDGVGPRIEPADQGQQGPPAGGTLGAFLLDLEGQGIVLGHHHPGRNPRQPPCPESRITSYNVCYTKLLRAMSLAEISSIILSLMYPV